MNLTVVAFTPLRPFWRPVLTVAQVFWLADRMPPRFHAMVLLAVFASLRWADILAHLEKYTAGAQDALVFTGDQGSALRRPNFNPRVKWTATVGA